MSVVKVVFLVTFMSSSKYSQSGSTLLNTFVTKTKNLQVKNENENSKLSDSMCCVVVLTSNAEHVS